MPQTYTMKKQHDRMQQNTSNICVNDPGAFKTNLDDYCFIGLNFFFDNSKIILTSNSLIIERKNKVHSEVSYLMSDVYEGIPLQL